VAVLGPGWRAQVPSYALGPPVFAFPNFRKLGKFVAYIERPKTKSASASGGLCPLTRGYAPGLCWGLHP